MRLGRMLILVAIVLVVVLGLVFVLSSTIGGGGGDVTPTPEVVLNHVVVLAQPVSRGERLTAEKLTSFEFPQERIPPTMFTDVTTVVGKIARFDMGAGTFLTQSMVLDDPGQLDTATGSDHALLIPPGMVAFPIPISRFSSVAWGLQRGDRVNVIATLLFVDLDTQFQTLLPNETSAIVPPGQSLLLTVESEEGEGAVAVDSEFAGDLNNLVATIISAGQVGRVGRAELDSVLNQPFYLVPSEFAQRPRLVSQTVMQNVVVLQMGTFPLPEDEAAVQPTPDPNDPNAQAQAQNQAAAEAEAAAVETPPPDIITLIVSPQDAVTLNYLLYSGAELTLALRSASDTSTTPTQAVTLQFLLDTYQIPVPTRLPYGLTPRLDVLLPPVLENDIPTTPRP
ncbi:MAG: flagella basal body P-ring formation protein FlgA [Chloroflexi bacterium]|nr:flagella basal body P-ring formation protein FlgA [Chloroflexota bacterium]